MPTTGGTPAEPALITITADIGLTHINKETVRLVTITDLTDSTKSATCYNAYVCSAKVNRGDLFSVTVTSNKHFAIAAPDLGVRLRNGQNIFDSYVATVSGTANHPVVVEFAHTDLVQGLEISGTKSASLSYTYGNNDYPETTTGGKTYFRVKPLEFNIGDTITADESWVNGEPIKWTGLPDGLSLKPGGGFSGTFSTPGVYAVDGRIGWEKQNYFARLDIIVKGLVAPSELVATSTGPGTADLRLVAKVKSYPKTDFFKVKVVEKTSGTVTYKVLDGDGTRGSLSGLYPGKKYNVSVQSCWAVSGECSEATSAEELTQKGLPVVYSGTFSAGSNNTATTEWVGNSLSGVRVVITGQSNRSFILKPNVNLNLTKANISELAKKTGFSASAYGFISGKTPSASKTFGPFTFGKNTITFQFVKK